MTGDYQQIKLILDKAMLGEDPMDQFRKVLPRIREFSSVDSAWITNIAFIVKFKKGNTVSWILNPEDLSHPKQ